MGPYEEQSTRLKPLLPGLPWLTILHSYDMQDDWTAATLHPLLNRRYDTAIAVDIITYPRNKAQRRAEMAINAARHARCRGCHLCASRAASTNPARDPACDRRQRSQRRGVRGQRRRDQGSACSSPAADAQR